METTRLGRDVFMALASVAWADGDMDAEEADALARTALEEGLSVEDVQAIEEATKKPLSIFDVDISKLTKDDRLFVYAVGAWMTRLDGKQTEDEQRALDQLAVALRIPDKPRQHAELIAREIVEDSAGADAVRFDLPRMRRVIADRLAHAQRLRAQQK